MSEMTDEEALRHAAALVSHEVKETEARCRVLGQYISDCDRQGSKSAAWSGALRELHELHDRRAALKVRYSLIQEALDVHVHERPAKVPLTTPRDRHEVRTQRQVQIRARRRS
jgi:hypothetical protein